MVPETKERFGAWCQAVYLSQQLAALCEAFADMPHEVQRLLVDIGNEIAAAESWDVNLSGESRNYAWAYKVITLRLKQVS